MKFGGIRFAFPPYALLLLLAVVFGWKTASGMQLVSISAPKLGPNAYISAFKINTWGIQIRAICKFPVGWIIKAGKELNPGGLVAGSASGFMTNLNMRQLDMLQDLFLIEDPLEHQRSPTEPPTFSGWLSIGEYGKPAPPRDRRIGLGGANIILKQATQCRAPTEDR